MELAVVVLLQVPLAEEVLREVVHEVEELLSQSELVTMLLPPRKTVELLVVQAVGEEKVEAVVLAVAVVAVADLLTGTR